MPSVQEEWRPVIGYERRYEVSNLGRVRSIARHVRARFGYRLMRGHVLVEQAQTSGYAKVFLGRGNTKYVHRLAAEAFIPNPDGKDEVNHLNGDKRDNAVVNLEWVTPSENMMHAFRTGLMPRGEAMRAGKKLTAHEVRTIRRTGTMLPKATLAKKYGVCPRTIRDIMTRETWRWLADDERS